MPSVVPVHAGEAASLFSRKAGNFARERPAVFALTATGVGLGLWAGAKARRDGFVFSQNPHESLFPPPEAYVKTSFLSQVAKLRRQGEPFLFPGEAPGGSGNFVEDDGADETTRGRANTREVGETGEGEGEIQTACATSGVGTPSISAFFEELLPPEIFPTFSKSRKRASSVRVIRSPLIPLGRGAGAFRQASRLLHDFDPTVFTENGDTRGQRQGQHRREKQRGEDRWRKDKWGQGDKKRAGMEREKGSVQFVVSNSRDSDRNEGGGDRTVSARRARGDSENFRVGSPAALLLRHLPFRWRLLPLTVAARETNCPVALSGASERARCMQFGMEENEVRPQTPGAKRFRAHVQGYEKQRESAGKEKDNEEKEETKTEKEEKTKTEKEEREKNAPKTLRRGVARCSSLWFAVARSAVSSSYSGFLVFRLFFLPPSSSPGLSSSSREGEVLLEVLAVHGGDHEDTLPFSAELPGLLASRLGVELRRQLTARLQRLRALEEEPKRKREERQNEEGSESREEKKGDDKPRDEESDDLTQDASYEGLEQAWTADSAERGSPSSTAGEDASGVFGGCDRMRREITSRSCRVPDLTGDQSPLRQAADARAPLFFRMHFAAEDQD
ncbi:UNVERIFIED_CONTAM: hypothetical protein HHA_254820 [Hammondia hammondi]|eukprot:XP_008885107.1 hypothetical protein HHA_254820 [Hammondia hammondi]